MKNKNKLIVGLVGASLLLGLSQSAEAIIVPVPALPSPNDIFNLNSSGSLISGLLDSPEGNASLMKLFSGMGQSNASLVAFLNNSMHKRVGELSWKYSNELPGVKHETFSLWARSNVRKFNLDSGKYQTEIKGTTPIFEIGGDVMFEMNNDKVFVGLMGQFSDSDQDLTQGGFGSTGTSSITATLDTKTKSVGAYTTWLGANGYYADAVIRQHNIESETPTNNNLSKISLEQNITALSLELGKEIILGEEAGNANKEIVYKLVEVDSNKEGLKIAKSSQEAVLAINYMEPEKVYYGEYFVIPRVQINADYYNSETINNPYGMEVKLKSYMPYTLSGGVIFGKRFVEASELTDQDATRMQVYGKITASYDVNNKIVLQNMSSGLITEEDFSGSKIELGAGFSAKLNKTFSLYLDGAYKVGSDYKELGAILGGRAEF